MDAAGKTSADAPLMLFFCEEMSALAAGEGGVKAMEVRKNNPKAKLTIFDNPTVVGEIKKAGVVPVKIALTKDNAELIKRFRVGGNSVVLLTSSGKGLAALYGDNCTQSALMSLLKQVSATKAAAK